MAENELEASVRGPVAVLRTERMYRGVLIEPHGPNTWGMRWLACPENGRVLRADTLAGMKRLIREMKP